MSGAQWVVVLASFVSALTAGGLLIVQSTVNARREDRRRELEHADQERRDARQSREQWVAAFQAATVAEKRLRQIWAAAVNDRPKTDGHREWIRRIVDARDAAEAALQMALGRLLVVEVDPLVRSFSVLFSEGLTAANLPPTTTESEAQAIAAAERIRVGKLYSAFLEFTRILSGLDADDARLIEDLTRGMGTAIGENEEIFRDGLRQHLAQRRRGRAAESPDLPPRRARPSLAQPT
jgi:HEPN domain-containing protein